MAKTRTFDQLEKARKRRTRSEWIPLDPDLMAEIEELEREIRIAERQDERDGNTAAAKAPRLRTQLEELQARAADTAVRFTATALPRKRYRALIDQAPSKDKDRRWDDETFAPLLISACITEPEGVDGQVIWDEWDEATATAVYRLCLLVNEEPPKVPFSVTSTGETHGSPTSSTSASETAEA